MMTKQERITIACGIHDEIDKVEQYLDKLRYELKVIKGSKGIGDYRRLGFLEELEERKTEDYV